VRADFEKALRQAVKEYLTNNHLVSDEDRDGLGIPIHKTTHTPFTLEFDESERGKTFTQIINN
ncbi:MAG: hypothetical protein LBP85_00815, partial [Prevotellaceae bacterium]|nr:hypothetical protein [Prevotellaceae bacterium]